MPGDRGQTRTSHTGRHGAEHRTHYSRGAGTVPACCSCENSAEWSFAEWLADRSVPVVRPLRTANGDLAVELRAPEGVRVAALAHWVPGQNLRRKYSAEAARRYGEALGSIHRRADEAGHTFGRRALDRAFLVECSHARFRAAFPERRQGTMWLDKAADAVGSALDALPRDPPGFGVVHGDAVRVNAQVSDDGAVVVIDFDLCGPGWRALDVASFLEMTRDEPYAAEAESSFVSGYEHARTRSTAEVAAIPALRAACRFLAIGVPSAFADVWGRTYAEHVVDLELPALRRTVEELEAAN